MADDPRPTDDPRPAVRLGMPGYAGLTGAAAKGFWLATTPGRFAIKRHAVEGSLLANNFNRLWCWALNEAKTDRCDYFAMQHADIEPDAGWLDVLIDELDRTGLDVLGVPAPIKDARGLTSTALARDDGDTWRVHARLTVAELQRLPETFTAADVGGRPLLLNTGLWACRFNPEWARLCRFTINDRIVVGPDGEYRPEVEPEDWFFSRLLNELGLKVGCTRKVRLTHRGPFAFPNDRAWGDRFDSQAVDRSPLDEAADADVAAWFPSDVPGWLTEPEGAELARLAAGKAVLEVGAYCGRSTVCLARTAKWVTTVDPFDGRGTAAEGDTYPAFKAAMHRHGITPDKVAAHRGTAAAVLPKLPAVYDLAFIDGAHDYESVSQDAALAADLLRPGGLLVFHDYSDRDPGVWRAVDELVAAGGAVLGRVDSLAVVRPPELVPLTLAGV